MTTKTHSPKIRKSALLAAASAAAIFMSAGTVWAQCTPSPAQDGDSVICEAGVYLGGLSFFVDDLTLVVGDEITPTVISNFGDGPGVGLRVIADDGDSDIRILNSDSYVEGWSSGVLVEHTNTAGDIDLEIHGRADANFDAVRVRHFGEGDTRVFVENARGGRNGVYITSVAGNISLTSTGTISGGSGIVINERSALGHYVNIDVNNVSSSELNSSAIRVFGEGGVNVITRGEISSRLTGLDIRAADESGQISIVNLGSISVGGTGIYAQSEGIHNNTISITNSGTINAQSVGIFVNHRGGNGDIEIVSGGDVVSNSASIFVRHSGTGNISLSANNLTSIYSDGISVPGSSTDQISDITISVSGTAQSLREEDTYGNAIQVYHTGTGNLTIDVNNAYSVAGDGLSLGATSTVQEVSVISDGIITGGQNGIHLFAQNTGQVTI